MTREAQPLDLAITNCGHLLSLAKDRSYSRAEFGRIAAIRLQSIVSALELAKAQAREIETQKEQTAEWVSKVMMWSKLAEDHQSTGQGYWEKLQAAEARVAELEKALERADQLIGWSILNSGECLADYPAALEKFSQFRNRDLREILATAIAALKEE